MSEPFLAEIRVVSFQFPPKGWALCNGQLLPINQNQALFSLLGTTYGGNGQTNFALPNLRGRTPIHFGNGYTLGQSGGAEFHVLSPAEVPDHTHAAIMAATADADAKTPAGNRPAVSGVELYARSGPLVPMHAQAVTGNAGGGQAHNNMQPYLTLNFIIALQGIYPSRT